MWNFQGSWWLGREISKGSNAILWNFHGWSFVFSEISRDLSKRNKNFHGFSKKYALDSPVGFLFLEKPNQ